MIADAVERKDSSDTGHYGDVYIMGFCFFLIVIMLIVSMFFALKEYYYDGDNLTVDTVSITGEIDEQTISLISSQLSDSGQLHNFIRMDVNEIYEVVKSIPWIETASVRKKWPANLYLYVKEKKPVARWNERQLYSTSAGIYDAPEWRNFSGLVLLKGPDSKADYVYQTFLDFKNILEPTGLGIVSVLLTNRMSWELELNNGVTLIIGRNNSEFSEIEEQQNKVSQRVERFAKVYPQIYKNFDDISYIDLRYDSGMAIGWKN